jgi:hypothetical protein
VARERTGVERALAGVLRAVIRGEEKGPLVDLVLDAAAEKVQDPRPEDDLPDVAVAFYNKRGTAEQWIKEGKANLVVRVKTIDRYDN